MSTPESPGFSRGEHVNAERDALRASVQRVRDVLGDVGK